MTLGGAPATDLDSMLRDVGVPVVINGVAGYGLVKEGDEEGVADAMSHLIGSEITLTVRTGAFPALAPDVAVTVDGAAFVCIHTRKKRNGTTRVYLHRP